MHRSPKNASERAPGPVPRTTTAWCPAEWPPVRTTETPGSSSRSPSAQPSAPQSATRRSSGWIVGGHQPGVAAERDLPLRRAGQRSAPAGTPSSRRRGAGRRRGRSGGGSSRRRRRCRDRSRPRAAPARPACPSYSRIARFLSSRRSPMPVSISTRPAGVSTSRQLSAWRSRRFSSSSPSASERHRIHGTGPEDRARRRCGRCPPGSARRASRRRGRRCQWTASLMPTGFSPRPCASDRARSRAWNADAVGSDWPWYLEPSSFDPYGRSTGRAHPEEADLPDPHPVVERDRQVGDVGQLERQRALPARVHVAGRRVDEQPEAAQRATCPRGARPGRPAARPTRASGRARTRPGAG